MRKTAPRNKIHQILLNSAPRVFDPAPVLFAYFYGSHARGDAHPFSDVDIAIYTDLKDLEQIRRLECDLGLALDVCLRHEAPTDVRTLHTLPIAVVGEILTFGHLIYSRNEPVRVDFEVYARKRYFDFKPVLQNYYREALKRMRGQ